jgi:hypothetical protein
MFRSLRNRLSFANLVSVIALFVALGGGAAYAANALPQNTVGPKQLKKNAVVTSKIKANAVTGAKIKESTLGMVPSASTATSAKTATTATVATTATTAAAVAKGAIKGANLGPITTVTATSPSFATGTSGTASVQCPAGSVALSGGGSASAPKVFSELNRKNDPQGWRYDARNESGASVTISVYAYCLG